MTAKAFVLIETEVGKPKEVIAKIRQLKGVTSVDLVTGPYDAIAIVEAEDLNAVVNLITGKLHPVAGISRTVICLAIRIG